MIQSILSNQPVTKANRNPVPAIKHSYGAPTDYYDITGDDDDDDFMSPSLDEINFEELAVEDDKDFRYDDDIEEDMEDEDED